MLYRLSLHLDMYLISETMDMVTTEPVTAAMNPFNSTVWPRLPPTHTLQTVPSDLEVLILPGGLASLSPLINDTIDWVGATYPSLRYLITVCTGAQVAARAGVLDGRRATTNKKSWDFVVKSGPNTEWVPHARWVVDGNIWSTSGVQAGMDGMLAFVEEMYGAENATLVQNSIEYERQDDPGYDQFAAIWGVE